MRMTFLKKGKIELTFIEERTFLRKYEQKIIIITNDT